MSALTEAGAAVDAADNDGCTPLFYSVGNPLVTQWLLLHGADPNTRNRNGV